MPQVNGSPHLFQFDQHMAANNLSPGDATQTPAPTIPGLAEGIDLGDWDLSAGFPLDLNVTQGAEQGQADSSYSFVDMGPAPDNRQAQIERFNRELNRPADHQFTRQRMSRGEAVERLRGLAEETFGEGGTKALIGLGGVAHLATGGDIDFNLGEFDASVSRDGLRIERKWKF